MRCLVLSLCAVFSLGMLGCHQPKYADYLQSAPKMATTDADAHVVILTGYARSFNRTELPCEAILQRLLATEELGYAHGVSSEVWPWQKLCSDRPFREFELMTDSQGNRLRGKALAERLREWRDRNPHKRLYLVAEVAAGWVVMGGVESRNEAGEPVLGEEDDRLFYRVLLLATMIQPDRSITKLATRCEQGVFNYVCPHEPVLDGYGSDTAGRDGFRNPPSSLRQLYSTTKVEPTENVVPFEYYSENLCRRFLVPLFHKDPNRVPPAWR